MTIQRYLLLSEDGKLIGTPAGLPFVYKAALKNADRLFKLTGKSYMVREITSLLEVSVNGNSSAIPQGRRTKAQKAEGPVGAADRMDENPGKG